MRLLEITIAVFVSGLVIIACKKSSDDSPMPTTEPSVSITAYSPEGGCMGTTVYITGKGFSSTTTDNKVKFNNVDANINTSNDSLIVATVPQNAGTGPITVTRGTKTATSSSSFIYVNSTTTTFAGSITSGSSDGSAAAASFKNPWGITLDGQGNLYVCDQGNNLIRKITSAGVVTTIAGNGPGYAEGVGAAAKFNSPQGIAVDGQGNLYVADFNNRRIRKITSTGTVTTFAGDGTSGLADGLGTSAQFLIPSALTIDAQGNIYVSDGLRMRKITPVGLVSTFAGTARPQDMFGAVGGLTVNSQGIILSGESERIRKTSSTGTVSLVANTPLSYCLQHAVSTDQQDNIFYTHHAGIRKLTTTGQHIALAGPTFLPEFSIIPTCPGSGFANGDGAMAMFNYPKGLVVSSQGVIYVSDFSNNCIRKVIFQ